MPNFLDLPNELLFKILEATRTRGTRKFYVNDRVELEKYDKTDLLSLCLVSRRVSAIAQEVLYRDVHTGKMRESQLPLLAVTLFRRPDLARKVRNLTLMEHDTRWNEPEFGLQAWETVQVIRPAFDRYQSFLLDLQTTPNVWVRLSVCLLPNVRKLHVRYRQRVSFMEYAFGEDNSTEGAQVPRPQFLSTVEDLKVCPIYSFDRAHFEWHLPDLPKLRRLSFEVPGFIPTEWKSPLALRSVNLKFAPQIELNKREMNRLSNFLSACAQLKHVSLEVFLALNEQETDLEHYFETMVLFRKLIRVLEQLRPIKETLESFDLALNGLSFIPHMHFLQEETALQNRIDFVDIRLKHLTLPQAALVCSEGTSETQTLCKILPPTLKTLVVRCVSLEAIRIYKGLLSCLDNFPCLSLFVVQRQYHLSAEYFREIKFSSKLAKVVSDRLPVRIEMDEYGQ
jgi:hypothetical protein